MQLTIIPCRTLAYLSFSAWNDAELAQNVTEHHLGQQLYKTHADTVSLTISEWDISEWIDIFRVIFQKSEVR